MLALSHQCECVSTKITSITEEYLSRNRRITKALENHNKSSCIHRQKVYIIVPFSCNCKDTLSKADNKIFVLDTIHPVYKDLSGNKRKYTFDLYTFKDSEQVRSPILLFIYLLFIDYMLLNTCST